jgi:hypothetical protein
MEIPATDLPEKITARLSTAHPVTMVLRHYSEIGGRRESENLEPHATHTS